jgi:CheY-like chemotaxis protein
MTETILIVDDSTFIVEGLVALLKKSYAPVPSYSGEECLSILRTVKPSLIILDIMMEPMDGWETLARIKENPSTRHIPVLMFSAKKISPEEAEAHRIIIDDFLTKPVNPRKLLEAIEKVLSRQSLNRKITDTWNAAGVSPHIIDEYLNLKTNLDVDVSLLAVMKKQLDIAYPDAVNRTDLEHSIHALEERIDLGRARINAFCQEQAEILPAIDHLEDNSPAPPVTTPVTVQPPAPVRYRANTPVPDEEISSVPVVSPPSPEPVPAIPVPAVSPPHDVSPGSQTFPRETDVAAVNPAELAGKSPVERSPNLIIPEIPAPPPGPKPGLYHFPEVVSSPADPILPEPLPEPKVTPALPVPSSGPELTVPEHTEQFSLFEPFEAPAEPLQPFSAVRQESPRVHSQRNSPESEDAAALPGSGTDTPRMRSQGMTSREQKREQQDNDERISRHPSGSDSILARIFAAIRSIFQRKT